MPLKEKKRSTTFCIVHTLRVTHHTVGVGNNKIKTKQNGKLKSKYRKSLPQGRAL
jgi:hypothetical protein